MELKEVGWGSMEWIYLAGDRDRRRALSNVAMKLRIPQTHKMQGIS
jgi:hypothetical protein